MLRRAVAIAVWAFGCWLLITWTATAGQLAFGALLAIAIGAALAPLGAVAAPWRLLDPRRLVALGRLLGAAAVRIVRANLSLAARIWRPSRPLRSGMIVLPTRARSDGVVAASGLITSLIVDNQVVDLDRRRHRVQYHVMAAPAGSQQERAEAVNAPVERLVRAVRREW
ncbi:MAG TPA: Na+/H+ antiporter subunit E [Jatrophihabitans sp.]|jgi:multicomponent Na+:H+ antiporter subunit E|nr:Na+/H+ antiporter subunit E [Jatrophihabitans sp.]